MYLIPKNIKIVDSGKAIAKQTSHILEEQKMLTPADNLPVCAFYSNSYHIISPSGFFCRWKNGR